MKLEGPDLNGKIVIKKEDEPVGEIKLVDYDSGVVGFGLDIKEGHRHKGFGAEAVRLLLPFLEKRGIEVFLLQ